MPAKLTPFADDAASMAIEELTIENGQDRVAVYGNLDLTRDKAGLQRARALKGILDEIVRVLEAEKNLPDRVPPPERPGQAKNPFA